MGASAILRRTPAWVRDPLYRAAGQLPAVDWWPARDLSLVDRIRGLPLTFTRTTGRTVVLPDGSNGTLSANEPAFVYRNGISLGLDVSDTRTNLFLNTATPATQSITVTAAAHALSFKGTGTITLSGASTAGPLVGTSATERVPLVFTPSAGSLTLTLSGSITEPQLEVGGFASPFIPTTVSAVQRTIDLPSTTNLSWFNPAEGTLLIVATPNGIGSQNYFGAFATGSTFSNSHLLYAVSGSVRGETFVSGAGQAQVTVGTMTAGDQQIVAYAYRANDFNAARNSTLGTPDTSGSLPAIDTFYLGTSFASGSAINGPIARALYWPRALPGVIQRLTTP